MISHDTGMFNNNSKMCGEPACDHIQALRIQPAVLAIIVRGCLRSCQLRTVDRLVFEHMVSILRVGGGQVGMSLL